MLSISRDAIDWNVQYDLLHDLYTDQDGIFEIDDLDDIPRYTRYDPQKIAKEHLQSSNIEFRDELNGVVPLINSGLMYYFLLTKRITSAMSTRSAW